MLFRSSAFFSVVFYTASLLSMSVLSMSTYCLCFGVEGEVFDGRDKKDINCIDPMGKACLNVGVAGRMGFVKRRRENPT